ncbi:hypothetical protein SAMN05216404_10930 [Nitrosospira multiformis]|uniref:Uncharacterized protein n=1 Tax=Nitrosospira multiformis TaxID=1231 RepID=A0A1H8KS91_9PROT|nr:hypothetical protein SAMN05216404_10930 [Nitrosospira multiformis]
MEPGTKISSNLSSLWVRNESPSHLLLISYEYSICPDSKRSKKVKKVTFEVTPFEVTPKSPKGKQAFNIRAA